MKTKELTEKQGITLISLVVTIIVILIISGVSVVTLTGQNGIINKASSTKENKEKEETKTKIDLAVTSALYDGLEDDEIDLNTLNDELVKDSITIVKKEAQNDLPWIVEENGKKFKIKPDGTVIEKVSVKILDKDGVEQLVAEEDVSDWYGKAVSNYTKGGTYRIFYIDFDGYFGDIGTIYLKADYDDDRTMACSLEYESNTLVRTMNPEWAKYRGDMEISWNDNEKAAAWLCSPTNDLNEEDGIWKNYFDKDRANYAIGGPSLCMYIKSYNKLDTHTIKLDHLFSTNAVPGYRFKPTNDGNLDNGYGRYTIRNILSEDRDYMYCKKDKQWWLSSPCATGKGYICIVYGDLCLLERWWTFPIFWNLSINFTKINLHTSNIRRLTKNQYVIKRIGFSNFINLISSHPSKLP